MQDYAVDLLQKHQDGSRELPTPDELWSNVWKNYRLANASVIGWDSHTRLNLDSQQIMQQMLTDGESSGSTSDLDFILTLDGIRRVLTAREITVLVLHDLMGYSYNTVSKMTKLGTPGTLHAARRRAVLRLRSSMQDSDLGTRNSLSIIALLEHTALGQVRRAATRLWVPSVIETWLSSENAFLDGARPIDVVQTEGPSRVLDAIEAEASGAYA